MKTVTICGSMRFANEMKSIAYYLETQQKFNVLQCVYLPDNVVPTDEDIKVLEVAHYPVYFIAVFPVEEHADADLQK